MTQHKDRKAAVRARMAAAGEPYAEAARQLKHQHDRPSDPYGPIRIWVAASDCMIADPARRASWGRQAGSIRLVLAAVREAAMAAGSDVVDLGAVRLARHAGVSAKTALGALQALREEPDPLLDLVARRQPGRASLYKLRIPAAYAASARSAWRCATAGLAGTSEVRISRDGGRSFLARHACPLPDDPPQQPCTIGVYHPGEATGRMLAFDLDPARSGDADGQAAGLGRLLGQLGARYIADISPSGGRHIYVPFAVALPWTDLRDLAGAIALRFPAAGVAAMSSLRGQISPPGSVHKHGGWRVLAMPAAQARASVEQPNGPQVWAGLLAEFDSERQWINGPLPGPLDAIARTGHPGPYSTRSEARMAVLCSAAARGWTLADIQAAIDAGTWAGLASLYSRPGQPGRMTRLLAVEYRRVTAMITR
jgi:hypothetical protein